MPYRVPSTVAATTAVAAGGWIFSGAGSAPPAAVPIDLPVNRTLTSVPAGGTLLITWPAMGGAEQGVVTALAVTTDDPTNTRVTTRVAGVAVPPLVQVFGAVGPMENPTPLAVPIRLGPTQVFSLLLENVGAVAFNMAARTLGWRAS